MRNPLLILLLAALAAPAFACDEMGELRRAMEQARAQSRDGRLEAARRSIAEAALLKDVMERCLTLVYFPGLFDLSTQPASIEARDGADYRAVSARLPFLRGTPGARVALAPGKERAAQFALLKADYAATLAAAAAHLRAAGEQPGAMTWLWGMAEWGRQTQVKDGAAQFSVLTRAQRDAVLAPAPAAEAAPRDPRE